MKTRKYLEEMFYDKFDICSEWTHFWMEDYTKFIFDTIIPEVLKSVMPNFTYNKDTTREECFKEIRIRTKELYNIDL